MIELTDIGLTVSSVGFVLSLIPAIRDALRGRTTMTLAASIPTTVLLLNTSFWMFQLGQSLTALTTVLTAACWAFLAVQRWREDS